MHKFILFFENCLGCSLMHSKENTYKFHLLSGLDDLVYPYGHFFLNNNLTRQDLNLTKRRSWAIFSMSVCVSRGTQSTHDVINFLALI